MRALRWTPYCLVLGLFAASCQDAPDRSANDPTAPETVRADAPLPPGCDLRDVKALARGYLENPEQQAAREAITAMEAACGAENTEDGDDTLTPVVTDRAWFVMGLVDQALNAVPDRVGDPGDGALLVSRLADCIDDIDGDRTICAPSGALSAALVQPSLERFGAFGVRSDDQGRVLAREPIPFDGNAARWGVSVDAPWSDVTGAEHVLVYGSPGGTDVPPAAQLDVPGYEFETFPADTRPDRVEVVHDFPNGDLHVWVCFEEPVSFADDRAARLQRNAVLLEEFVSDAECAGLFVAQASVVAGLRGMLRSLFSARALGVGISIGGTPINFSDFSGVAALTEGYLVPEIFIGETVDTLDGSYQFPDAEADSTLADSIVVTAFSGDGIPMEKVLVELSIRANQGVAADGTFVDDKGDPLVDDEDNIVTPSGTTNEEDGSVTFEDIRLGKPGGYVLCVKGTLAGFSFPEVCSAGSHIDNNTPAGS